MYIRTFADIHKTHRANTAHAVRLLTSDPIHQSESYDALILEDQPKRVPMETNQTIKLEQTNQQLHATSANMSGSTFTNVALAGAIFTDVNLAGATISDCNMSGCCVQNVNLSGPQLSQANLTGASIAESLTEGMTIDGIAVADLFAAYRAAKLQPNPIA